MNFDLLPLPYELNALEPHISRETLEYHHSRHHQAYMTNLQKLTLDTEFVDMSLEDIIKKTSGKIFNNAAQIWNHTFYWRCMDPHSEGKPSEPLADAIAKTFGSLEQFKDEFSKVAIGTFGSGWAWLVKNPDGTLEIMSTSNAGTPMTENKKALLTCDVWEHAYYIDYRNARPKYVDAFWNIVNWAFVAENFTEK